MNGYEQARTRVLSSSRIQISDTLRVRAAAELELRRRIENETAHLDRQMREAAERERVTYYQTHPIDYIVDRLRIRRETIQWSTLPQYATHKWDGDVDPLAKILEYVAESHWVGVESAVGVGKTFVGAALIFWFLENFFQSRVITIAPKEDQLAKGIWRELNLKFPAFGKGEMMSKELRLDPRPEVWEASQFTAGVKASEIQTSATKAQGIHGEHLLIIFEETPGVAEAVMTAIKDRMSAPHNIIVAFGNPDHQGDTLHEFCRMDRVKSIRISGFDHPNVVLKDPNFIPGAQTEIGLKTLLDGYNKNENHPLYLSRAKGISPAQGAHSLIKWEWCERASRRHPDQALKGERALGVDVANSEAGDDAAIAEGVGSCLEVVDAFPCPRVDLLATSQVYSRMQLKKIDAGYVGIDGVGVGASTVNKMYELGEEIVNIQSGGGQIELPDTEQKMHEIFNCLRSQGWWILARDLERPDSHLVLPYDKELFNDLCTPTWETRSGKICIEAKEAIKKRLGRSPNKGDAVMYWNLVRRGWMATAKDIFVGRL